MNDHTELPPAVADAAAAYVARLLEGGQDVNGVEIRMTARSKTWWVFCETPTGERRKKLGCESPRS